MSATGLEVFDKTLQTTNIWLKEISEEIGPDRHTAWKVLSVVLHKLRDRLPVDVAAHLGAELPLLVRGVYYDQFKPASQPSDCRDMDEFVGHVQHWLADARPVDANRDDLLTEQIAHMVPRIKARPETLVAGRAVGHSVRI